MKKDYTVIIGKKGLKATQETEPSRAVIVRVLSLSSLIMFLRESNKSKIRPSIRAPFLLCTIHDGQICFRYLKLLIGFI